MLNIAWRNLRLFFRDKTSVFFSLLSVFITIGLYVLFLGDMITHDTHGQGNIRFMIDSWIMAGVLAITAITTTMGAFGTMVDDRSKKIIKDFSASPIKRSTLAGGYILSSFAVGVIISIVALILGEIYIVLSGGALLPFAAVLKVLGLIMISVLAGTSMVYFLVSFFKSQNAFATASTIIGTLIGFLTGVYIPAGVLPDEVQWVIRIFPISHAGALFRQVMMEAPMSEVYAEAAEQAEAFKIHMGVVYQFGDTPVTVLGSLGILLFTAAVFYGLAVLNLSRKSK